MVTSLMWSISTKAKAWWVQLKHRATSTYSQASIEIQEASLMGRQILSITEEKFWCPITKTLIEIRPLTPIISTISRKALLWTSFKRLSSISSPPALLCWFLIKRLKNKMLNFGCLFKTYWPLLTAKQRAKQKTKNLKTSRIIINRKKTFS